MTIMKTKTLMPILIIIFITLSLAYLILNKHESRTHESTNLDSRTHDSTNQGSTSQDSTTQESTIKPMVELVRNDNRVLPKISKEDLQKVKETL